MADKVKINPNLNQQQKDVLFNNATEAPFTGELLHNKERGMYTCAACGNQLFDSGTKFDSGSGWPSFYDVATKGAVKLQGDTTHGVHRIEATCANCGSHLGHVFDDANDQPTGQRYCINSCALDFKPQKK